MGDVLLSEPACDLGCAPCSRRCAVAQIQISYWAREEERLLRERVAVADRHWHQWRDDLAEASAHVTRLRQDILSACPVIPLAGRAARLAAPAQARLQ